MTTFKFSKIEHGPGSIPFATADEVFAFCDDMASNYRINPFLVPVGKTVDDILKDFKSKFLVVASERGVLDEMLIFFDSEVLHGDLDDSGSEDESSEGNNDMNNDDNDDDDDDDADDDDDDNKTGDRNLETQLDNDAAKLRVYDNRESGSSENDNDFTMEADDSNPDTSSDCKETNQYKSTAIVDVDDDDKSVEYLISNGLDKGNGTVVGQDDDNTLTMNQDHEHASVDSTESLKQTFLTADENVICKFPFVALRNSRIDIIDICHGTGIGLQLFQTPIQHTLLMECVSNETVNMEQLEYLLDKVDINIEEPLRNRTALFVCLANRHIECSQKLAVVRKLIHTGANLTNKGRLPWSALHMYIYVLLDPVDKMFNDNWRDIVEELIDAGIDIDAKDYSDSTVLKTAITRIAPDGELPPGHDPPTQLGYDVVNYLLDKGAEVDAKDGDGRSCFCNAALTQNSKLLKMLIKHIKDINATDHLGMNCIYDICAYSKLDDDNIGMLDILANAGCSLNVQAIDGSTVLHHAAATQSYMVCDKLCQLGADPNLKDYLLRTPLHFANRNKDATVVDVLVKHGAIVDSKAKHGETPLHHACLLDNLNTAKLLVAAGANVESQTVLGVRPIHLTAENGDDEFIQYMTQLSNINATDKYGANALHYAASDGNIEALEYLLHAGCDKDQKDFNNQTPLDLALYMGHQKVSERLSSPTVPRFGNFPPLCFPNRPLIEEEEVDKFYDDLAAKFKSGKKRSLDIVNNLLVCNGFGSVDFDSGDGKLISDLIVGYGDKIAARIGELDPLFACICLRAGSTHEGVKTGYPDEFDFHCKLTLWEKHVETIEDGGTEGFVYIKLKESAPSELLRYCPRPDRRVDASLMLRHFSMLSRIATYNILSEMDFGGHIYAGYMLLPENIPLFTGNNFPLCKLNGQTLTFRGKAHKFLDISIDLNPVIFVNNYPKEALQKCRVVEDVISRGVYCVPKYCGHVPFMYEDGRTTSQKLWRLSTYHIEAEALRSMPQIARDCYVVCKILRMEPLTCAVKDQDLKEVDEEDLERFEEMNNSDDDSEPCSLETEEVGDMENESDDNTGVTVRVDDMNHLDNNADDTGTSHGVVTVGFGVNDFMYEESELTAEKMIPSYYIKSIFIKEMDKLMQQGVKLSKNSLVDIPRSVYKELMKSLEEQHLTTLFMPKHNMLKKAVNAHVSQIETRMRETYCRKVLWLIDQWQSSD